METAYSNRELEAKFDGIHTKLEDNKETILAELAGITTQVKFTNGKVRKIIIALIGVGFFTLGLGFQQLAPLLKILLAL